MLHHGDSKSLCVTHAQDKEPVISPSLLCTKHGRHLGMGSVYKASQGAGMCAAHFTDAETTCPFSICEAMGRTRVSCMLVECSTAELQLQTSPIFRGSPLSRDSKDADLAIDNLVTPQPCLSRRAFAQCCYE